MPPTDTLLDLAVTLHPEHDPARQAQMALLAGRLGYVEVWLPVPTPPASDVLTALATAAAPARLGLRLPALPAAVPADVPDLLLMTHLPGPGASERVSYPSGRNGPVTAGVVVAAPTRPELYRLVAAAVADRARAGRTAADSPVLADVPVAIGRTMQEAEARAARDPRFAGEGHPREGGLFGTYEHGQGQVLELAAAGADGLLVTLADELDVADLLAQVRALVVGATPVLHARRG